jgi:hypothetical protein
MSNFALVSTVDSMGEEFPSHCVMLFDTERDAILHAVKRIVACDPTTKYIEEEEVWTMGNDHWDEPNDFLEAWQDNLSPTEYFHIKPVVSVDTKLFVMGD